MMLHTNYFEPSNHILDCDGQFVKDIVQDRVIDRVVDRVIDRERNRVRNRKS
jgi:hypothetical protein